MTPSSDHFTTSGTDCPQRVHEDPSLPRLTLPTDTSGPTGPGRCTPGDQRQSGPEDTFYLVSRRVFHNNKPDVVLECMGSQWEFQCPHFTKSGTLANLHMAARQQRVKLQQERTGSNRSARNRPLSQPSISGLSRDQQKGGKLPGSLPLRLAVKHHTVTKDALSVAPRALYGPEGCLDGWEETLVSVASLLGLPQLFKRCLTEMIDKISCSTVCDLHHVSCRYKERSLQRACERWLELHLVTELSCFTILRDLPFEVLHKTLCSPRLFAGCEYDLLKTVLYWVFLQFNPDAQIMPSHRTIISFFSRTGVFLEQPKGHKFIVLFQAVRLHGITERRHLEELQMISVFPQAWLLSMFSKHYDTLHSGGDMHVTDFSHQAVRFGMVVEKEPQYCTQVIELYGFYFLLKAACSVDTDTHGFSLQRLRHSEPAMSVQACERHPVSAFQYDVSTLGDLSDQCPG
ncbi:BTB/POZ domain-containing protein 16 [Hypomesus transpacificus]|uniref:BTB/POZ domain-containing protein 16 n=1 Tax=Hypomesus transpacificus TaxID=137520 RepID=UPI001F081016|nr:BTB/POZ domain-containing protein 16 [Hypomesus transpacificus]